MSFLIDIYCPSQIWALNLQRVLSNTPIYGNDPPNLSNCVHLIFVVLADYLNVVLAQAKFRWLFGSKVLRVKSRTETYCATVRAICSRLQDSKESAPREIAWKPQGAGERRLSRACKHCFQYLILDIPYDWSILTVYVHHINCLASRTQRQRKHLANVWNPPTRHILTF